MAAKVPFRIIVLTEEGSKLHGVRASITGTSGKVVSQLLSGLLPSFAKLRSQVTVSILHISWTGTLIAFPHNS